MNKSKLRRTVRRWALQLVVLINAIQQQKILIPPKVLLRARVRWRERPLGGRSYVVSHQTPGIVGCRSRIIPWHGESLNRPWMPIPPPRGVGSFCLESIYLINHAVSTPGKPRPQYALPELDHSTNYGRVPTTNDQLRIGCSQAELPRTYRLEWTDYRG